MLTLGTYVGIPVTVLVLVALALGLRWLLRWEPGPAEDDVMRYVAIGAAVTAIVATGGIFTGSWWPFDMDYHRWHERSGSVDVAERRLLGGGDSGMSEVFVIRFVGDSTLYRCDDTRCALAKPGKEVRLLCKPVWEYAAVDGWECRYGQSS